MGWDVSRVTTPQLQSWLVREANRLMSELTVDGKPIGAVGKLVERRDSRGMLPVLNLEE